MKPELVVALDVPSSAAASQVIAALPDEILYYKVGLELFAADGPKIFERLIAANKKIFLDLKLHDIPRTVAGAVASAARHGVALLTVHAGGGNDMLKAAAQSAREQGPNAPKILAVTTLTSLNENDLRELGIGRPLKEHTLALAQLALSAGSDGLVCSPHEAMAFRKAFGAEPILVTPGIRPGPTTGERPRKVRAAKHSLDDQKRAATPELAVMAGANFLVVGRPILNADDPCRAAKDILEEMNKAYANPTSSGQDQHGRQTTTP